MERLIQENDYFSKQIPILTGKLETYRARLSENPELLKDKELLNQKDEKIIELENEKNNNKEKIRMNTQLTQALSDSVKREEQLKKQCDQLLESLHSALGEDEKLAIRIAQMEENMEYLQTMLKEKDEELNKLKDSNNAKGASIANRGKISEIARLIENDIEKGGNK